MQSVMSTPDKSCLFPKVKLWKPPLSGYRQAVPDLRDSFRELLSADSPVGQLYQNSYNGVYGKLSSLPPYSQTIPMAQSQEVKEGPVQIMTTVEGEKPRLFDAYIEKVSLSQDEPTKNMVLRITDPELLELSGGIVQGMSGSPIIQDGMLVGAVTHV